MTTTDEIVPTPEAFDFDPLLGCPFDCSEMRIAQSWEKYRMGQRVQFRGLNELGTRIFPDVQGTIVAIGENAKTDDGSPFTAFIVRVGAAFHYKTHRDISPVTEENAFTAENLTALFQGKPVSITHTGNPSLGDAVGTVRMFHAHTLGPGVDVALVNGSRYSRYGFVPDTVSTLAAEGNISASIAGRRRIEIIR